MDRIFARCGRIMVYFSPFSGAEEVVIHMAYGRLGAAMVQSLERVWWADEARRIQRL